MGSLRSLGLGLVLLLGCATPPQSSVTPFGADVVVPRGGERVVVDQAFLIADVSGSVDGAGAYPDSKALVQSFTAGMPDGSYQSGGLAFGGGQRLDETLASFGRDRMTGWAAAIPSLRDSTPLRHQLRRAGNRLAGAGGRAAVVVFSDGLPNLYGEPDAAGSLAAAHAMAAEHGGNVCIYPVQLGSDPAGASFMQDLAKVTGCGMYRQASAIGDAGSLHAYQRAIFLGAGAPPPRPVAKPAPGDADGDGVVDGTDRCPRTPNGAKVDGRGCWVIRGLNFDTNKADIKPEFEPRLNEVVAVLRANPDVRIRVDGHTDSRGSEAYNQQLSFRRARSVADYFERRGIPGGRLAVKGFGESRPVAPNDTPQNLYLNRRTELSVID